MNYTIHLARCPPCGPAERDCPRPTRIALAAAQSRLHSPAQRQKIHKCSYGPRPNRVARVPVARCALCATTSQATTWAWARILATRLGQKAAQPIQAIHRNRMVLRAFRWDKTAPRPTASQTLKHFCPLPSPFPSAPLPRTGHRQQRRPW
jgi:hypothetical protein